MQFVLLISLCLVFFENSYATEVTCPYKNNQDLEPKGYFRVPQDQDSVGWCYAFALGDLITAKIKKPVSSTQLSLVYLLYELNTKNSKTGQLFSDSEMINSITGIGSHVEWVWKVMERNDRQICLENNMPNNAQELSSVDPNLKKSWISLALENLRHKRNLVNKSEAELKEENEKQTSWLYNISVWFRENILDQKTVSQQEAENSLCHLFKNVNLQDIKDIIKTTASESISTTLKILLDQSCQPSIKLDARYKLQTYPPSGERLEMAKLIKNMDEQINNNNLVSISYEVDDFLKDTKINFGKSGHVSTVVGREMRDGVCGYLIRNSWGMGCSIYKDEIQKNCNPQEGTFWVTEEQFLLSTQAMQWIE